MATSSKAHQAGEFPELSFKITEHGCDIDRQGNIYDYTRTVGTFPFSLDGCKRAKRAYLDAFSGTVDQIAPRSRGYWSVMKGGRELDEIMGSDFLPTTGRRRFISAWGRGIMIRDLETSMVEAGLSWGLVHDLFLRQLETTPQAKRLSIEEAGAAAIMARRMSYAEADAFAARLSRGAASHGETISKAYSRAAAPPDHEALARDLIAMHVTGGDAGAAVRDRIARRLADVVRSLARPVDAPAFAPQQS